MSETKFTPGPWRFMGCEVVGANNSTVAVLVNDGNHTIPNQHLMAAAPELYEALVVAVKELEALYDSHAAIEYDGEHGVINTRSALAKARGDA